MIDETSSMQKCTHQMATPPKRCEIYLVACTYLPQPIIPFISSLNLSLPFPPSSFCFDRFHITRMKIRGCLRSLSLSISTLIISLSFSTWIPPSVPLSLSSASFSLLLTLFYLVLPLLFLSLYLYFSFSLFNLFLPPPHFLFYTQMSVIESVYDDEVLFLFLTLFVFLNYLHFTLVSLSTW